MAGPQKPSSPLTSPEEFTECLRSVKRLCERLCYRDGYEILKHPEFHNSPVLEWLNLLAGSAFALQELNFRLSQFPGLLRRDHMRQRDLDAQPVEHSEEG